MNILTNEQLTLLVVELGNRVKELESKGKRSTFKAPTSEDVMNYMNERGCYQSVDEAEKFCDFYASKGWVVGKVKMKDWKASVRQWLKRQATNQPALPIGQSNNKQAVRTALRDIRSTDW